MKFIGDAWPEGDGIFETIRVQDQKVFALHRHHCRAKETADKLGFDIPTEAEVAFASYEVIRQFDYPVGRLRWHFGRDLEFSISYVNFEDPIKPARLAIFDTRSNDFSVRNKEYPYRNLEMLETVKKRGYDDAIILTKDGQVSETTIATLLLKIRDQWVTPPLSSGILNGVVRALVIEADLASVRRIDEGELEQVQSGLLLTSLRNAQEIGEIAGKKLTLDSQKCAEIHKLMNEFKGL